MQLELWELHRWEMPSHYLKKKILIRLVLNLLKSKGLQQIWMFHRYLKPYGCASKNSNKLRSNSILRGYFYLLIVMVLAPSPTKTWQFREQKISQQSMLILNCSQWPILTRCDQHSISESSTPIWYHLMKMRPCSTTMASSMLMLPTIVCLNSWREFGKKNTRKEFKESVSLKLPRTVKLDCNSSQLLCQLRNPQLEKLMLRTTSH